MDSISTGELVDATMSLLDSADAQFQYWIGITFALILTGYLVGPRLTHRIKFIISTLYVVSVSFFVDKFMVVSGNAARFIAELIDRDIEWDLLQWPYWGMLIVMVFGGIAAVWFFNFGDKFRRESENESTIAST